MRALIIGIPAAQGWTAVRRTLILVFVLATLAIAPRAFAVRYSPDLHACETTSECAEGESCTTVEDDPAGSGRYCVLTESDPLKRLDHCRNDYFVNRELCKFKRNYYNWTEDEYRTCVDDTDTRLCECIKGIFPSTNCSDLTP